MVKLSIFKQSTLNQATDYQSSSFKQVTLKKLEASLLQTSTHIHQITTQNRFKFPPTSPFNPLKYCIDRTSKEFPSIAKLLQPAKEKNCRPKLPRTRHQRLCTKRSIINYAFLSSQRFFFSPDFFCLRCSQVSCQP
jgi:hypothetical protein